MRVQRYAFIELRVTLQPGAMEMVHWVKVPAVREFLGATWWKETTSSGKDPLAYTPPPPHTHTRWGVNQIAKINKNVAFPSQDQNHNSLFIFFPTSSFFLVRCPFILFVEDSLPAVTQSSKKVIYDILALQYNGAGIMGICSKIHPLFFF
jgi:hypothetical protein